MDFAPSVVTIFLEQPEIHGCNDGYLLGRCAGRNGGEEIMNMEKTFATVSPGDLKKWLDEKRDVVLIDTEIEELYEARHLPGAHCACVFKVVFPREIEAIIADRDRDVVVYGSSSASRDAVTAVEKMERLGYRRVYVLDGGIKAWREAGFPLEGKNPEGEEPQAPSLRPENRTYALDADASIIHWAGRNNNLRHYGTMKLKAGEFTIKDGEITGSFVIDMNSIRDENLKGDELLPVLESHLKSDDFFFTERYPTALFTIRKVTPNANASPTTPNVTVEGALTLLGTEGTLSFPANIVSREDGTIAANAQFDVDRTRWGVMYGSARFYEHLGMHLVYDAVSIYVHLEAR